jgi:hypothetical protein
VFGRGRGWNSSVGLGGALRCGMNDSVNTVLEEKEENCEYLSWSGKEIVSVGREFRLRRQQGIQPIVAVEGMIPLITGKSREGY